MFPDDSVHLVDDVNAMIRPQTCPICEKELAADAGLNSPLFPFCSQRCKDVDLYRWGEGKYQIVEPLKPEHLQNPDVDLPEELEELL